MHIQHVLWEDGDGAVPIQPRLPACRTEVAVPTQELLGSMPGVVYGRLVYNNALIVSLHEEDAAPPE